jgi:hypothetical protein
VNEGLFLKCVHASVDFVDAFLHFVALLFELLDGLVVLLVGDFVEISFEVGQ